MSKKLDKPTTESTETNGIDSLGTTSNLPFNPKRDITGFPNRKGKVYLVASIKKTPCLGDCPIYESKLYSNGKTTFYGRRNVEMKGRHEGQISEPNMQALINKMNAVNFFNFESSYPTKLQRGVSEFSTTILTSQIGDRFKKVKINSNPPVALKEYEVYLEKLFGEVEWSGREFLGLIVLTLSFLLWKPPPRESVFKKPISKKPISKKPSSTNVILP